MRYYIVDAFTDRLFSGNQAGVCILETWPEDATMQDIAAENNLSETAFAAHDGAHYKLRWFTPATEIELCGHATLATAFVLANFVEPEAAEFEFHTLSGPLFVRRNGDLFELNFPVRAQQETEVTAQMRRAVDKLVVSAYAGYNLMLELEDENAVRDLVPDIEAIRDLRDYHGVIATARGSDCDFVSRFFAPNVGVDEDPVTGSTHTSLVPFWAARLGREELTARQLSKRGGMLYCRYAGDRVHISGHARLYLTGEIHL